MMTRTLSLCIATFNRAMFLEETLECIASQSEPDVEVVVLDGGSTDRTSDVVQKFRERIPHLRYERKGEPGGVDRDFDSAVSIASGEYCWLMADDDRLVPGALRAVLNRLSRRALSLLVVNAGIYNEDFSSVLRARALDFGDDRTYEPGDNTRLFVELGNHLSFIGATIVRRELWCSRTRDSYFGSQFIHVGVLFQAPLPMAAVLMVQPLVAIRYGNASWTARTFEIWMFTWPDLIWSFGQFTDEAKAAVCSREPWRSIRRLLLYRAKGAYSLRDYRTLLASRIASPALRLPALAIALVPGVLCNMIAISVLRLFYRDAAVALLDLRKSRFNLVHRLKTSTSSAQHA